MASIVKLARIRHFREILPSACGGSKSRNISTSEKKKDSQVPAKQQVHEIPDFSKPGKYWISMGFNFTDRIEDRFEMHNAYFVGVSIMLIISFYWAYVPDYGQREWARREAFLLLREREEKGLPPIDVNIVPAEQVKLPPDEELEDSQIII